MKDLEKARKILNKVNTLFDSLEEDAGALAAIELDLMRAYLRELYELFLAGEAGNANSTPSRKESNISEEPAGNKVRIFKSDPKEESKPESRPDPAPLDRSKTDYQPPRIIDLPDSLSELTREPEEEQETKPTPPPPVKKTKPLVAAEDDDEEVEDLFAQPQARELSEKLSELPISDLTKAMGLNEKIFTINELFDGDQKVFEQTLHTLNSLSSFEEAKAFLSRNVALKFDWADKSRKKKAKNFIKLVRRRFS